MSLKKFHIYEVVRGLNKYFTGFTLNHSSIKGNTEFSSYYFGSFPQLDMQRNDSPGVQKQTMRNDVCLRVYCLYLFTFTARVLSVWYFNNMCLRLQRFLYREGLFPIVLTAVVMKGRYENYSTTTLLSQRGFSESVIHRTSLLLMGQSVSCLGVVDHSLLCVFL